MIVKLKCLSIWLLAVATTVQGRRLQAIDLNSTELQEDGRDARNLLPIPFLGMVRFPQDTCKSATNANEVGVCMKRNQCTTLGGKDIGTCAQGFGVCCSVIKMCTEDIQTVNVNGSHLIQGSKMEEVCRYEIPRQVGVCQIKLDFNKFKIDQGTDEVLEFTHKCDADQLIISGHTLADSIGPLCGTLDGQHMYLDYGTNDKISIDIYLESTAMQQAWDISVTMIKCNSEEKAPPGCLQYFTSPKGTVKSFNYPSRQLNGQNYAVCVKSTPGLKKITWKTCEDMGDTPFTISGPEIQPGEPGVAVPPITGDACTTDYISFFGGSVSRVCGATLRGTVLATSNTQPFIMQVHFDEEESPFPPTDPDFLNDFGNVGFCLSYQTSAR